MKESNAFLCHIANKNNMQNIDVRSYNSPLWAQAEGILWNCPENTLTASHEKDIVCLTLYDISSGTREIEWNPNTSQAILRRTELWSKPFYFFMGDGELIISDSLRRVLRALPARPQLNVHALDSYLALEFFPAPMTPFCGIYKVGVEESCILDLSGQNMKWIAEPMQERLSDDFEKAVEDVSEALYTALKKHTYDDPDKLVLLCSGGLDSTIMAHFMHGEGRAIVLSYADSWKDEVIRARQTAEHSGLPLQEILLPDFSVEQFSKYSELLDEPLGGTCSYPLSHLCRAVQPGKRIIGGHGSGVLSLTHFMYRHLRTSMDFGEPGMLVDRFCSNAAYMDARMRNRLLDCSPEVQQQDPIVEMLEGELPYQKDIFCALHAVIRRQLCVAEETTQIWPIFEAFGHKPVIPLLERSVYTIFDRFRESVLHSETNERRVLNEIALRSCPGYVPQPRQLGYGLPLGLAAYPNELNMEEIVAAFSKGPFSESGLYWLLESCKKVESGEEKFYWLRRLWSAALLNAWFERNFETYF